MFMNFPATARNFKKFMEISRLSYFWHIIEHVEHFTRAGIESKFFWRVLSLVMSRMIQKDSGK